MTKTKTYLQKNIGKWIIIGNIALIGISAQITLLVNNSEAYANTLEGNTTQFIGKNKIPPKGNNKIIKSQKIIPKKEEIALCSLDDVICPDEKTQIASWYDYELDGIEWSKDHNTCASRDLKRYSMARVTNIDTGASVECYVNDYGPEVGQTPERQIDLSSHAFKQIADLKYGLADVIIEQL